MKLVCYLPPKKVLDNTKIHMSEVIGLNINFDEESNLIIKRNNLLEISLLLNKYKRLVKYFYIERTLKKLYNI